MKNIIIISYVILTLTYCTTDKNNNTLLNKIEIKDTISKKDVVLDLKSPAYFMGSDFITFMQSCSRIGDYDRMLFFTSSKSLKRHGEKKVMEFYKNVEFNYEMKLKSIQYVDSHYVMHYTSNRFATKGLARFNVIIENDTCKLLLPEKFNTFGK